MSVMTMAGAPYTHGDWLSVAGADARVVEIERLPDPQPFGRHWAIIAARATDGAWLEVQVDDNGYNKSGNLVGPSSIVED